MWWDPPSGDDIEWDHKNGHILFVTYMFAAIPCITVLKIFIIFAQLHCSMLENNMEDSQPFLKIWPLN